jgi:hypothetical protein
LLIFTGRSVRKSFRLDTNPRERGFWDPPSRGAVLPSGKTTLGTGVPGSLHFGAIVLNAIFASRYPILSLALRFASGANGCPEAQWLTYHQIHYNIVTLTRESEFPNIAVQAQRYRK